MKLVILKDTPARIPRKRINRLFETIAEEEGESDWRAAVNLVITSDTRIRKLNQEFRRKDRSTDVLSFNIDSPEGAENTFGEVYISAATAARQAAEIGVALSHEYLRLACHGLLHLFGYDHERERDAGMMVEREGHFLASVGVRIS
jgi:probable rRNA maturation factor